MEKKQALERLTALETEAAALRAIIESPEREPSLLTKPTPGSGDVYYRIVSNYGIFGVEKDFSSNPRKSAYLAGNFFQTGKLAEDYEQAINTMLLLRHQPGTCAVSNDFSQFVLEPDFYLEIIKVNAWESCSCKANCISPCFDNKENALNAIKTIGEDRIIRMFKTFHGIYE